MNFKVLIIIGILLALIIVASIQSLIKEKINLKKRLLASYGKSSKRKISDDEMQTIARYFNMRKEMIDASTGKMPFYIDDITWNDLDMDRFYALINNCKSSAGQEYLYKRLRMPENDLGKALYFDKLAKFFDQNEDCRIKVQKIFVKLGITKKISVSDYISSLMQLEAEKNTIHVIALLAMLLSFVVAFAVNPVIGILMIIASVSFSIISYYRYKAKVEPYFICFTQLVKMVKAADQVVKLDIEALGHNNDKLDTISHDFSKLVKNSWLLTSTNVNGSFVEMIMDYLRMLTHVDLMRFNSCLNYLDGMESEVFDLFETLGLIEASICVASFRRTIPYWSEPRFTKDKNLMVKDLYHPLIKNPVSNSLASERNVLLTGSNASGKSTFLKSVAVNALLAQTIYTSLSSAYKAPFFRIYSSMALRDSLSSQDSFYMVEIKALKRILDAIDDQSKEEPVLAMIDEVLKGTNTVERIAASSQILKNLKDKNVLVFAATHDIELTSMLAREYDNYHFMEEVSQDEVRFDYKMQEGPATTRNAIKLLKMMGYDKKIIRDAESEAEFFTQMGAWRK